jgi:hypothetical protein
MGGTGATVDGEANAVKIQPVRPTLTGYIPGVRRLNVTRAHGDRARRLCREAGSRVLVVPLLLVLSLAARPVSLLGQPLAASPAPVVVTIGRPVIPLNGPWRFRTGDDIRWAAPAFDDAAWEIVDLTPPAGAHDPDVGLTGYVDGWGKRGHAGYWGFAWYRLRVLTDAPAGDTLALSGPLEVNDAYEIYIDGQLAGASGDFSGAIPVAYNTRPSVYEILPARPGPAGEHGRAVEIAIRVWMPHGSASASPGDGGVRIAPAIGELSGIAAHHEQEWLAKFLGYVVDVAEPAVFLVLAVMACSVSAFNPSDAAYGWTAIALVVLAANRANHAFFYWTADESERTADIVQSVLLIPLTLGAWTEAWRAWFRLAAPRWVRKAIVILTGLYMVAELMTRPWWPGSIPHLVVASSHAASTLVRLSFVLLWCLIVLRGVRQQGGDGWFAVPAMVFLAAGLFAQELSALYIPGIWFPFGVGVSRTQYVFVPFAIGLFALLMHRLLGFASRQGGAAARAGAA